ncbi:hypothetical protein H5410_027089 [Solanum commersonii]|uniref:DUF4283 domain-containing protein n=1 Tax=Solanum commersonii TaxID=4109 RepID=A0A9J5Z0B9_SOLCO|nr:hypothetical protein H5410_027089 [Solanum commersonii]
MAMMATDQSSTTMIDQPHLASPPKIPIPNDNQSLSTMDYSKFLKLNTMNNNSPSTTMTATISVKPITLLHGEPYLKWIESEVSKMNTIENMQHVIIGKLLYGWLDLDELRTSIPAQCNIKGDCQIGYFRNRHILIRLALKEDFINLTSKPAYYIKAKDGAA